MKYMRVLDDKGKDAADDYARTTARKAIEFVAANPRIIDKADALVRITEIIVRIAASFAEAVATGDLERAETWAEAAWRRAADAEERGLSA